MPLKYDLVLADEEEYVFSDSVTSIHDVATREAKTSVSKPKFVGESLIKDWISDSEDENETEFKSKQRKPSFAKIEFVKSNEHVKTPRESVKKIENKKQVKYPRKNSQSPRGNFVPKAVFMKSGIKTLNTVRQNFSKTAVSVNTARPINTAYPRPTVNSTRTASNDFNRAHTHVRRPFNKSTTNKNSNLKEKVNIVKGDVTTVGPKAVVSDNKGYEANVVKASACWVWRPNQKGNPQLELHQKGVIDSGCSRYMTRNMSYLSDYEEIDGGFVAFGGDPKGGRITGKDALTISMNYKPVVTGNQTNGNAGIKENINACQTRKKIVPHQEYILLPLLTSDPSISKSSKDTPDAGFKPSGEEENIDSEHQENEDSEVPNTQEPRVNQEQDANVNSTNNINTINLTVSVADIENNVVDENIVYECIDDPNMPNLEEIVYSNDDEEVGAEADMNN
ncbi:hypothetical protein Tco_0654535 [Tanacetum coccineum]|uniref:Uncharacterized protein n=1 Tax=Tanacetum coccineum TaxID=301880 RepID=A0ABQ4X3J7_9ASTR